MKEMKSQQPKDRQKRANRIANNRKHSKENRGQKPDRLPPRRSIDCQYMAIEDVLMEHGYYD